MNQAVSRAGGSISRPLIFPLFFPFSPRTMLHSLSHEKPEILWRRDFTHRPAQGQTWAAKVAKWYIAVIRKAVRTPKISVFRNCNSRFAANERK